jgi:CBS domain-containing protein
MSVGKICNRTVITARPDETVEAAAKRMKKYDVGALVVVEDNKPIGIITDRDLVLRVLAQECVPQEQDIRSKMTGSLVCVPEHTPLEEAMNLMRGYQIRRLVIVNDARELVGIFTLDDMLELLGEEQQAIAGLLRSVRSPRC